MRILSLLLTVLFLSCSSPRPAQGSDRARPVADALHSTVQFIRQDGSTYCSGVVTEGVILTAAHCADDLVLRVRWMGQTFLAQVAELDDVQDVAVLEPMDGRDLGRGIKVARKAPGFAASVWAIGHPLGTYTFSITRGIVSFPRRVGGPYEGMVWMQHDAGAVGGNSGGPVVDRRGHIVGILSFGALTPIKCIVSCQGAYQGTHVSGAAHLESIVNILNAYRKHK